MPALAAKGLSDARALAVVVWFGPAQVAGRLAYLAFGRWVSSRTLGLVVLGGLPVSLAIFALADGTFALLLFALLFGLANGLVTIVRGSLVPEYFGREHVGRISGAMSGDRAALARRGATGHRLAAARAARLPRAAAGAGGARRRGRAGVRAGAAARSLACRFQLGQHLCGQVSTDSASVARSDAPASLRQSSMRREAEANTAQPRRTAVRHRRRDAARGAPPGAGGTAGPGRCRRW